MIICDDVTTTGVFILLTPEEYDKCKNSLSYKKKILEAFNEEMHQDIKRYRVLPFNEKEYINIEDIKAEAKKYGHGTEFSGKMILLGSERATELYKFDSFDKMQNCLKHLKKDDVDMSMCFSVNGEYVVEVLKEESACITCKEFGGEYASNRLVRYFAEHGSLIGYGKIIAEI